MTSNPNLDIIIKWSPLVEEDFILVGNAVNFYHLTSVDTSFKNRNENNFNVSESTCAKLIGSISNYPKEKIIAWYPSIDFGPYMIALLEADSNQIRMIRLFDQENRPNVIPSLNIGSSKKCNQMEWNPIKTTLLGLGFNKFESQNSICIWDLGYQSNAPLYQLDEYDTCYSFAWNPQSSEVLFASSENRLSLFDLRIGLKPIESLKTEFIHEFSIDQKNSYIAASHDGNNKIALWDLRKVRDSKKPIDFIDESKQIKKIQFCPSRSNRLAVLTENANYVKVYRLDEKNEILTKEQIQYQTNCKFVSGINAFSWHSKDWNKLMTGFTDSLNTLSLKDFIIAEYSHIGVSADERLNVAFNDKMCSFSISSINPEIEIGEKIKQRALKSYGIHDFLSNINLISNDKSEQEIKYLWQWLHTSSKLHEQNQDIYEKFSGIKSILFTVSPDVSNQDFNEVKKELILKLCEWYNWTEIVSKLETEGEFERAACIAVFNNGIDRASEILKNASIKKNSNEYLALTLPLIYNRSTLNNKNESSKILSKLSNPYIKALFAYKMDLDYNENEKIYNDSNILLPDRVCIAMNMLKNEFGSHIKTLTNSSIKEGSLYGILLTGLTADCIDLFQYYINRTSDVQTSVTAIINSICPKILSNKFVDGWIKSYRNLLDSWMLWEQRAQFDVKLSRPQAATVYIRCASCGSNLSTKKKHRIQGLENNANNGIACQSCQKPSLRCSVCSLYMTVDPSKSAFLGNKDKMTYWFLFCQKCSHGGHLGHLEKWFRTNPECPVMNCNCQCYVKEDFFEEFD
ncbi:unnamed protein product [Brachionus calyciflorus]|uniref:WD repeat protein mio zinc-ribbon like domain-containing protein n=1 Tax=Brachionus calyciflorus TaxID=104777 RepID=A0A813MG78_9BILA|nr:unnamed protein product [Brachionus calyciflorus]